MIHIIDMFSALYHTGEDAREAAAAGAAGIIVSAHGGTAARWVALSSKIGWRKTSS